VGDLAGAGRSAITTHVADDHRTITEPELGAVVLADPHSFGEARTPPTARRRPRGRGGRSGQG